MADLDDAQLTELQVDLEALAGELRAQIEEAEGGARPVDLDEPIGRISRMDAMQQQSMTQATRRAAQQRLVSTEAALRRLAEDEYGECGSCGEDMTFARLKARPDTPFCVVCQSQREGPR